MSVNNKISLIAAGSVILAAVLFVTLKEGKPKSAEILHGFKYSILDKPGPVNPWGKTVGDINGDGILDFIVGGNESKDLVAYLSPDHTKKVIAKDYRFSTDHEVADVDNDGKNDVLSITKSGIYWFKNPEWKAFQIDDKTLHDLEVFDFDGDGDIDIVARDQSAFGGEGGELNFYRQDAPDVWTSFTVKIPEGEGLTTADLDGDGLQDVVVNKFWLKNPGKLEKESWKSFEYADAWEWPHTFVATGDINGDGKTDIVLTPSEKEGGEYHISWFAHPGDAQQIWPEHIVEDNVETVLHFVGVGDIDEDGNDDIATAEMHQGKDPDEVKFYINENKGQTWSKRVLKNTGSHSMRLADVDRDGDLDLFGGNWSGEYQAVEFWENQRCPKFATWTRHEVDAGRPWQAVFIDAADLNADGYPDIIAGGWWYENPGENTKSWQRHDIGGEAYNMATLLDVDADGDTDILATKGKGSDANTEFVLAINDGSGEFDVSDVGAQGQGDFLQGIAITGVSETAIQVMLSWHRADMGIQELSIPKGGEGDEWPWRKISGFSQDEALSVGDIDRDGDNDLLLGTYWLRNDGAGGWTKVLLNKNSENPDRNKLADINGDGKLDAVVGYEAISKTGLLAWYEQGVDSGAPWIEHQIDEVTGPMSLDVADLDFDGDMDVVVGEHNLKSPEKARLLVYENIDGKGSKWKSHTVYTGDEHHDGAQLTDIDMDGDLDIISIGWGHDRVLYYENHSSRCLQ